MDGLRLPPLIEEALDSTGLCSCFYRGVCVRVSICVPVRLDWRVAIFSPALQMRSDLPQNVEGSMFKISAKEQCLHPK